MKTMGVSWRYPRKTSLLKHLRRGYLPAKGVCLFLVKDHRYASRESDWGILPRGRALGALSNYRIGGNEVDSTFGTPQGGRRSNCQRAETVHGCYQTANVCKTYVSLVGEIGQGKSMGGGRRPSLPQRRRKGWASLIVGRAGNVR